MRVRVQKVVEGVQSPTLAAGPDDLHLLLEEVGAEEAPYVMHRLHRPLLLGFDQ